MIAISTRAKNNVFDKRMKFVFIYPLNTSCNLLIDILPLFYYLINSNLVCNFYPFSLIQIFSIKLPVGRIFAVGRPQWHVRKYGRNLKATYSSAPSPSRRTTIFNESLINDSFHCRAKYSIHLWLIYSKIRVSLCELQARGHDDGQNGQMTLW